MNRYVYYIHFLIYVYHIQYTNCLCIYTHLYTYQPSTIYIYTIYMYTLCILIGHMDRSISDLSDASSTCDRLYTSPIPVTYTKHTARFLLLWLLTVPMALYHEVSD